MTVPTQSGPTFASRNPNTGDEVRRFPLQDEAAVATAVDAAHIAGRWWVDLGWTGRRARLQAWKGVIARRAEELAELVHREQGRPVDDILIEIIIAIDHIDWAARHAAKTLGVRSVRPSLLAINHAASLSYEPLGVVAVIGPWNYPVFTPLGSIAYALAAGNAVVFKPSEYTPAVGQWLVEAFAQVVPEHPVLQLITGDGSTGAALCRANVDKVSFTGSTATGKKIMAACAETLTPVLLECGGKDALLVDVDANLDHAADAAAYGAFSNAGQTCVAVERIYVAAEVYDKFLEKFTERVRDLHAGGGADASYGAMTMPSAAATVQAHVADALARGGRAVVGGPITPGTRTIDPVVLTDVPEDSLAMTAETFGPTVVINKVRDIDEAVDRANASEYGLAAAVFGKARAREAADRLRTGSVTINSWVMNASVPALPWGGVGSSGFGRIHGEDGLREFARAKSILRERFPAPIVLTSYARHPRSVSLVLKLTKALHGRS